MNAEQEYYISLIERLRNLPQETEWLEFKLNNDTPDMIGEYISALSNSAAICGRETAYLLWGINDETHEIEETSFFPKQAKVGNEELENWLARALKPRVDFKFAEVFTDKGKVVVMEIPAAVNRPTSFKDVEFIRIGSYKKKLKDYPEKERKLWLSFETKPFELRVAMDNVTASKVTELLDCATYYTLMKLPLPSNRDSIIHNMEDEEFIRRMDNGNYEITNMGALLFAKDLKIPAPKVETGDDFSRIKLYWYAGLNYWAKEDKIRTCYLHTCYCYVNEIEVSNAVLRERFGVDEKNKAIVSRIIKDTVDKGLIKMENETVGVRARRYVPYWA